MFYNVVLFGVTLGKNPDFRLNDHIPDFCFFAAKLKQTNISNKSFIFGKYANNVQFRKSFEG